MMLQFGSVPFLIASSAQAASQIMKTQDVGFADKPMSSIPSKLFFGPKDVAFTPYGEYWRNARSICMLQLLNNKRVQSFSKIGEEETSLLLKKIKDSIDSSQVVDLAELFVSMTNDVPCKVALGRKYCDGEEGKKFKTLLLEFVELLGVFNIGDFMPWLAWVNRFNGLNAKVDKVAAEFSAFLEGVIEEHRETKIDDEEEESADFVDILLQVQKENKSGFKVEMDSIKAFIMDMFSAGTDTTSTLLEWTMNELMRNPKTLRKLREEDTKVLGYDVAAGTQVFVCPWAISRDPTIWENPEEFQPERFLDSSVDYKGLDFGLIPFGAGRRGCPGITFAKVVNELALQWLRKLPFILKFYHDITAVYILQEKMTNESQMQDTTTTVGATSITSTSRANAPQPMAPTKKPKKFAGIDFKRWQQKMFFYLTTLCLQRFTSEDVPEVPEGTSDKERFIIVEAWKYSDFLCRNYILSGLQDDLYNIYTGTKTLNELCGTLE
ncbi:hypothetical protein CQW23_08252 [Capsicum baccatum]|uniref:Cytochrome 71A2 n=1 Tax=Capsicum baccatum TaxID=33114 RepID=A0A2G2X8I9_CAPBA|nr:hypothetical protein CQW23_08252 [Capsicum baccatum]